MIDGDVQLCVRNSVLKPNVMDGVVSGFAIDLSLSDGRHQLSGTADILIPMTYNPEKQIGAAYFNEETGEWEPVYFEQNKETGEIKITTDHLSEYAIFEVANVGMRNVMLNVYKEVPQLYVLNEAAKKLLDIISSPDPEWEMAWQYKNEMALWQSCSLDILYNAANGALEAVNGYKPFAEEVGNAVTAMGYLGTALNILDVARADLKGDDVGVAAGTLNTILNYTSGQLASAIGTPIMSVSMAGVAAIGIALNKFGEKVAQSKLDFYRLAYGIYYSKEGDKITGNKNYRTPTDWYNYFYPAFEKGNMTASELNAYIEESVHNYCNQFWKDESRTFCIAEAESRASSMGISTWSWETESLRKQISDEYFSELMNGILVSVFQSIRNHLKIEAHNRYTVAAKSVADLVNRQIAIRIWDNSWKEGEKSKYEGWTVRFSYIPSALPDKEDWQVTLNERGRGGIKYFTEYALILNDMPTRLSLIDPKGKEVADYPFEITNKKGKQIIDIDLSTGGVEVENPNLDGLELIYEPNSVEYYSEDHPEKAIYPITRIYFDNSNNKKARFETEIEKFFCRHEFITVDELGNFKIGDDIVGKFENNGLEGSGSFTLNTNYQFKEQNISDCIKVFNSPNWFSEHFEVFRPFNGTLEHKVKCEFTITRTSVDSKEYEITYTGEGTYSLQTEVLEYITGVVIADNLENSPTPNISAEDIHTTPITADGTFKLKYTTKLQ